MTARHIPALSVAGVAMLIGLAHAMTLIRTYGPVAREFLLWIVEAPTFCVTVTLTAIASATLTCLCALALGRIQP